jgi:hypothetical protein
MLTSALPALDCDPMAHIESLAGGRNCYLIGGMTHGASPPSWCLFTKGEEIITEHAKKLPSSGRCSERLMFDLQKQNIAPEELAREGQATYLAGQERVWMELMDTSISMNSPSRQAFELF